MLTMVLVGMLGAEPDRFLGGAQPTPLAVPGPVDTEPTLQACSTQTLRRSSGCLFDGRPAAVESDGARKKQAQDNIELASKLGSGLCNERIEPSTAGSKEKGRRLAACTEGTARASSACSLQGSEVLLDSEGRFSNQSRACYEALAEALQLADLPVTPTEAPLPRPRRSKSPGARP